MQKKDFDPILEWLLFKAQPAAYWLSWFCLFLSLPNAFIFFCLFFFFIGIAVLGILQGTLPDKADVFTSTWCILNPGTARWWREHLSPNAFTAMKAVSLQTEAVPWEGKAWERIG